MFFGWFKPKKKEEKNYIDLQKLTLREVEEISGKISIQDGGLAIMIRKIIIEIEKLQDPK